MGEILDRRDKGQLGGRTGGMQDWRDSGLDGCRKRGFMNEECRKGEM